MASEKFRHQLRREADRWQAEGLIDETLYAELARRYQFDDLAISEHNRFVAILIALGSILLGLAAIIFVAANWQIWSKEFKVASLVALFVGVNVVGFYLWQHPVERWQARLGKGLLLLGALIFGANLALMSQIFHRSGSLYHLFLVWSLGVLAMAYSLRLTFLGVLAILLASIGYVAGIITLFMPGEVSDFRIAIEHMPLLVSLLGIPLAYWCRSRWLFGLGAALVIFSLEANVIIFLANFINFSPGTRGMMGAIACSLPPALLWAYRDSLWNGSIEKLSFDAIARNLALFFISVLFYLFSFNGIWRPFSYRTGSEIAWHDWVKLLDILLLGDLTVWAWWRLGYRTSARWRLERKNAIVGAAILLIGVMVWWHLSVGALGAIATLIFNALLFLFAVGFIRKGLVTGHRLSFWGGILLTVLQIVSRMLEYETDLLAKAIVLLFCGLGIIAAGLGFEKYLQTLKALRATNDE